MMNCADLHKIINRGWKFHYGSEFTDILKIIPRNGIYIMFEKSEIGDDGNRIVYIGINKEGSLPNRLIKHFKGNIRNSRLRKHIGDCLLKRDNLLDLEKEISEYIQTNMSFILIQVQDIIKRKELEKMLIGTVARCGRSSSANWLGNFSPNDKIKKFGIWNVEHLDALSLTDDGIQLVYDGLILKCDISTQFKEFLMD